MPGLSCPHFWKLNRQLKGGSCTLSYLKPFLALLAAAFRACASAHQLFTCWAGTRSHFKAPATLYILQHLSFNAAASMCRNLPPTLALLSDTCSTPPPLVYDHNDLSEHRSPVVHLQAVSGASHTASIAAAALRRSPVVHLQAVSGASRTASISTAALRCSPVIHLEARRGGGDEEVPPIRGPIGGHAACCLGAAQQLQPVPVPELDITWQDAERREERRWPVQHTSPGASTRHALGALIGMH